MGVAAGVELVVLVDPAVVLAGFRGVGGQLVGPGQGADVIEGAPFVDGVDDGDTGRGWRGGTSDEIGCWKLGFDARRSQAYGGAEDDGREEDCE